MECKLKHVQVSFKGFFYVRSESWLKRKTDIHSRPAGKPFSICPSAVHERSIRQNFAKMKCKASFHTYRIKSAAHSCANSIGFLVKSSSAMPFTWLSRDPCEFLYSPDTSLETYSSYSYDYRCRNSDKNLPVREGKQIPVPRNRYPVFFLNIFLLCSTYYAPSMFDR